MRFDVSSTALLSRLQSISKVIVNKNSLPILDNFLFETLPEQAKNYVKFLESHIGVPITIVSTGPKRHEIALRQPQ